MDITGEDDDVDDAVPFRDDEPIGTQDDADGSDVSEPLTADEPDDLHDRAPWWILHGERIEGIALSNRIRKRESDRRRGFFPIYDTFWGYIDVDPLSVLPTVRDATIALDRRNDALQRLNSPHPIRLQVNVVVAAAVALGIVHGSAADRLVASAACLIFGFWFAMMVSRFAISSRSTAIVSAAVACVIVPAVPGDPRDTVV